MVRGAKVSCVGVLAAAAFLFAQHSTPAHRTPPPRPLVEKPSPTRQAQSLMRQGRTEEARQELNRLLKAAPGDAELWYQVARTHLMDFYREVEPLKRRLSLGLAMECMNAAIKRNGDHIPSLRAKAVIHARAELLYYDPNLAYELAARVAKLEPNANAYLLNLTEWMSGEVRFTQESGHRVPHDPLIGLDRSIDLLDRVIDSTMPYSNEESAALFGMGKALSRRGNFKESILYFEQLLTRAVTPEQRLEAMREMGTSYYRMGDFQEAARIYFQTLQVHNNLIDQWLLKVTLDQLPSAPAMSKQFLFPVAPVKVEAANPPMLEFRDIAPELGINRFDGNGTCAWGDYDLDGDLDLFLAGSGTFMAVYRNDGGKFKEVTTEVGLDKVPSGYSLNVIDYDNDGKLDLYIAYNGWSGPMPNRLYRNAGGRFEDVSAKCGAADPGDGFVSVWGDLDNDGYPDIVIANGVIKDGSTPEIYRNNGDGTFTNMTKKAGIVEPPTYGAIGAALGDYDKDGDLDILINGLGSSPTRLYRNDGGWHFTDVTRQSGVIQPDHNGFICFFFDYNNDGWQDILTTSLAPWDVVVDALRAGYAPSKAGMHPDASRLFRNNRNGTFTDVTYEAGLFRPMGVMGGGVADLDNDGYLDIYFGTGDPQLTRLEPNRFFRNNGDGTFTDLTEYVHFARPGNKGHGVSFVDIDNDGDLDLYAQLGGHYPGDMAYNAFYRNLKGNQNNWLQVDLRGLKANRFGIGAQLTLKAGALTAYREVKGSEGFGATNPYRVHFGIGKNTRIDSLEIRWPGGATRTLTNVGVNRVVSVTEGQEDSSGAH